MISMSIFLALRLCLYVDITFIAVSDLKKKDNYYVNEILISMEASFSHSSNLPTCLSLGAHTCSEALLQEDLWIDRV